MEQWLAFLDREHKVYNVVVAGDLLRKWTREKRLEDKDFTVMVKLRKAAAARDKVRKAAVKARIAERQARMAKAETANLRDSLRRKLGFPT